MRLRNRSKLSPRRYIEPIVSGALHKNPKSHPRQWVDRFKFFLISSTVMQVESHPRQWVDGFKFFLISSTVRQLESHPRQWVDGFKFFLISSTVMQVESHPRQWVDRSDPLPSIIEVSTHCRGWD